MNEIGKIHEKIEAEFQFLFSSALNETIVSRHYWGVGQHFLFPDLNQFTSNASAKFAVQVLGTRKEVDATDWYIDVSLLEPIRVAFEELGLSAVFQICVESSEEKGDVFYKFSKVKIHAPWHDFSSETELTLSDLERLYENLTKFTLMLRLAS